MSKIALPVTSRDARRLNSETPQPGLAGLATKSPNSASEICCIPTPRQADCFAARRGTRKDTRDLMRFWAGGVVVEFSVLDGSPLESLDI